MARGKVQARIAELMAPVIAKAPDDPHGMAGMADGVLPV